MTASEKFKAFSETDSVRADLGKRSVIGGMGLAGESALEFAMRLGSTVVLARLIVPEHWGLVALVLAVTAIAEQFRDLGLSAATVQRRNLTHDQVTNLFWINTAGGILIALVLSSLATTVSAFYEDSRLTLITVAISTNFIWTGVAVQHQALLTRQMKLTQMAVVRLVSNALSIAIGVGLALGGYTYWALIWKEISRNLFIAIGSVMVCPWLPGWPRRNADMGDLLRFGRDVGLTSVLAAIVMNVDRLVVGKFFGAVSVGMYRQAQNLIMTPVAQLAQPISAVSQPGLCALQGERDRFRQFYQRIVLIVSVFTVPLGLFVAMYASDITLIVLGDQWVDAAPFVVVFGLAAAIRPAIGTSTIVVLSCGHAQRLLKLELLHSAALVVYMAVGVQFGATGVAVADLLRTVTLMVPTLYLSFRDTPVDMSTFFRPFSGPLLASGVMVTGLLLARASVPAGMLPLSSVALGGGVALVAYTGAWILMGNARRELLSLVWQALDVFRGRSESRVQTVRAEL